MSFVPQEMRNSSIQQLTEQFKNCDTSERTEFRVTFVGTNKHFKEEQLSKLDRKLRFKHGKKPYDQDVTVRYNKNEQQRN